MVETCMWVKKQQLESCTEQLIGSRLRQQYNRAVCCHPVCFIYVEHIMRNAGLNELQAGIKVSGIHVDIWQKTTKFYKGIILQL